jgi:tRNA 2-thiocytidine biosynthesis protein TtcA
MLRAMAHLVPSHLMDRNLYPFTTIQPNGVADADGDVAFDEEPCGPSPAPGPAAIAMPMWAPRRDEEDAP